MSHYKDTPASFFLLSFHTLVILITQLAGTMEFLSVFYHYHFEKVKMDFCNSTKIHYNALYLFHLIQYEFYT